jgi:hypothetical protein
MRFRVVFVEGVLLLLRMLASRAGALRGDEVSEDDKAFLRADERVI